MNWEKALVAIIDFETTGLSPYDEICEIGIVRARGSTIISSFGGLVDPGMPISMLASGVSGITNSMVQGLPRIDHYIMFLNRLLLEVDGIVAHNAEFDLKYLRKIPEIQPRKIPYFCTMRRMKELGHKKVSLSESLRTTRVDVRYPNMHRAVHDAFATHQLFLKIAPKEYTIQNFYHGFL